MMRRAEFAGSWYPATAQECEAAIRDFLADGVPAPAEGVLGVGGIVPHAGWYFSGSIAARVVSLMASLRKPDLVAVFGMHLAPGHPNFIMADGVWETPFGPLSVAGDVAARLVEGFSFRVETALRHGKDNTIELNLPFIRHFFGDVKILPLGLPPEPRSLAVARAVADVATHLGYTLSVIGSTDLTHYGPNYDFSPKGHGPEALRWVKEDNDASVIKRMLFLDPEGVISEGLSRHNACCSGAAASAIAAAKSLGAASAQQIAYATSHDKSAGASLVGYAGIVF